MGSLGGQPETVIHGETGFVINGDDVHAIEDAVQTLIEDKDLTKRFREAGRRRAVAEFSWEKIVAPTALNFAPSSFGKYESWLFVGDCIFGNIYKFKLNSDRNGFVFEDFNLNDLVLHEEDNIEEILFGKGFGCITDIEIRGDNMYVVSIFDGTIYRIFLKDLL